MAKRLPIYRMPPSAIVLLSMVVVSLIGCGSSQNDMPTPRAVVEERQSAVPIEPVGPLTTSPAPETPDAGAPSAGNGVTSP